MKAVYLGFGALAVSLTAGCGSDSGTNPKPGIDFDHGTAVGAGGAATTELPAYDVTEYPPGPYGTQVGSVIAPIQMLGWNHPAEAGYDVEALEPVTPAKFWNPNGDKPTKLLWINSSAVWCGPCNAEYLEMRDSGTYRNELEPRGVDVIGTLMEDGKNPPGPATPSNLSAWGTKYEVEFALAVDPASKMGAYFTADAFPGGLLVETKYMTIVAKLSGGAITGPGGLIDKVDKALANLPE
jgi:hypothetical protein